MLDPAVKTELELAKTENRVLRGMVRELIDAHHALARCEQNCHSRWLKAEQLSEEFLESLP